jgi:hypothetical protein
VPEYIVENWQKAAFHNHGIGGRHADNAALRNLKPKDKPYKVPDRDGLYVYVLTSGTVYGRGRVGEVNFTERVWTIPAARMTRRNPHNVYLSNQALDILVALKTCAGGSP